MGRWLPGVTVDMSSGGVAIKIDDGRSTCGSATMQLIFPVLDGEATIPATIVVWYDGVVRARFDPLTLQEEEALTMVLYSRAQTRGWDGARPARSTGRCEAWDGSFALSMWGFKQMGC